jgi:predicted branched-subunit amino acid permease
MRRITYLILGALTGLLLGTLAAYAFNTWYSDHFVKSDDDANLMVSILLFGFWPLSTIIGALVGSRFYQRRAN